MYSLKTESRIQAPFYMSLAGKSVSINRPTSRDYMSLKRPCQLTPATVGYLSTQHLAFQRYGPKATDSEYIRPCHL